MKTETVKTIVIIVLAGLCLLLYLDEKCIIEFIPSTCQIDTIIKSDTVLISHGNACDDSLRYDIGIMAGEGGLPISKGDAITNIDRFYARMDASHITLPNRGAFISKKAFDQMFSKDPNANGMLAFFSINSGGKFTVVYTPTRSSFTELSSPTAPVNDNIFIAETWCPNVCGVFSQYCGQNCEVPPPHIQRSTNR